MEATIPRRKSRSSDDANQPSSSQSNPTQSPPPVLLSITASTPSFTTTSSISTAPAATKPQPEPASSSVHETDLGSITWRNPPNRALSADDSSPSLPLQCASKLVHHYPLGIDPSLLNSNPVLAKMLTSGYVGYDTFSALNAHQNAMLFTSPLLSPVLTAPLPTHFLSPPGANTCPSNLLFIVDELRKDPLRRVNPPNKVLLPGPLPDLRDRLGLLHQASVVTDHRHPVLGDDRLHLPRTRRHSDAVPPPPVKTDADVGTDVYRFTEGSSGAVT